MKTLTFTFFSAFFLLIINTAFADGKCASGNCSTNSACNNQASCKSVGCAWINNQCKSKN